LRPFIRAYEIATVPQDNPNSHERESRFHSLGSYQTPGQMGLVADADGWSFPANGGDDAADGIDHRSLVALIRNPRMVVEYYEAGERAPFVRGAFVADESVDEALRSTEPKSHDTWQTQPEDDVDPSAVDLADTILRRVKDNVRRFRQSLKPPTPAPAQVRLPEWDRLVRGLLRGPATDDPPPPPGDRDVTISLSPELQSAGPDRVRLVGQALIGLSDAHEAESAKIAVRFRYLLLEDDRAKDAVPLRLSAPAGFEFDEEDDHWRGTIRRDSPVQFAFESESHLALWSGRIVAEAEVIDEDASESLWAAKRARSVRSTRRRHSPMRCRLRVFGLAAASVKPMVACAFSVPTNT